MKKLIVCIVLSGIVGCTADPSTPVQQAALALPRDAQEPVAVPTTPPTKAERMQAAKEAKLKAAKEAKDAESERIDFAKALENSLLDEGYNCDVNAVGPRHTTLRLVWALATMVDVRGMTQNNMFSNAEQIGFNKMILTNGFEGELNQTWTWK